MSSTCPPSPIRRIQKPWIALCLAGMIPASLLAQDTPDNAPYEVTQLQATHTRHLQQAKDVYLRELKKLESLYLSRGDKDAASQVRALIEGPGGAPNFKVLCSVELDSAAPPAIKKLGVGEQRLAGVANGPEFSRVSDELVGMKFTQSAQRSTSDYQGKATKAGYLYVVGAESVKVDGESEKLQPVYRKIEGDDIKRELVGRIHLRQGQAFHCSGPELCLVAEEIVVE